MNIPIVTEIFLDYDDTLLPTTYLDTNNYKYDSDDPLPSQLVEWLDALATSIENLLKKASKYGTITIITNSENGWIRLSSNRFFPRLNKIFENLAIKYAGSDYGQQYPKQYVVWKYLAFKDALSLNFNNTTTQRQIISFGDSLTERYSLSALTPELPHTYFKSIKFVDCPRPLQLVSEINYITLIFDAIITINTDLDLMLTDQNLTKPINNY